MKITRKDMINCSLCHDAPCGKACEKMRPDRALRSIWFDNEKVAAVRLPEENPCENCVVPCEEQCVHPGKVPVKELMMRLCGMKQEIEGDKRHGDGSQRHGDGSLSPSGETENCHRVSSKDREPSPCLVERQRIVPISQSDTENRRRVSQNTSAILQTDICGIPLENPFLLSSSVVSSSYDMCARAFEAGWAGAVFKTVCSFDIHEASPRFGALPGSAGGFIGFKNIEQLSDKSVEENMETVRRLKKNYSKKAVIVSFMGRTKEEWGDLARICEESGADAVELNFSCPNMADGDLGSAIGQVPELVEEFTAEAKRSCNIPVLAKLTPNVADMSMAAEAAMRGGADGIAAINTIKSVMGIDPETFVSDPDVNGMSAVGGYSGNGVKPIALRFIAEMGNNSRLSGMHISGMGGIETWRDALDFILLGAGSLQVTTAVMKYGYRIIEDLISGLEYYLLERQGDRKPSPCPVSIKDMIGKGLPYISDTTDVLERDTKVLPVFDKEKCAGCGRCVISCSDGGHQALSMNEDRSIRLDGKKCVGCHLCALVCPEGAVRRDGKRF